MLLIRGLHKSYRQPEGLVDVLVDINLDIQAGSSLALLGESGSGKSTLLHIIAGLENPDSGDIEFQGQLRSQLSMAQLAAQRRNQLSLVFQQFHLISTLNIIDNIRFQAALCKRFDDEYENLLIEKLKLSGQLRKYPHQLSRGQQQRVAIARSLLHKPSLVLADEPTGNLDEQASLVVMSLFTELVKIAGSSLLMVTHSKEMAAFMNRSVRLQGGILNEFDLP